MTAMTNPTQGGTHGRHGASSSTLDHYRRPGESIPDWVQRLRGMAAKVFGARGLAEDKEVVPPVDALVVETARGILKYARDAEPKAWAQYVLPPMAICTVDFAGDGHVWINDDTFTSAAGRMLAEVLHRMGGARVHDGVMEGAECPPVGFWSAR